MSTNVCIRVYRMVTQKYAIHLFSFSNIRIITKKTKERLKADGADFRIIISKLQQNIKALYNSDPTEYFFLTYTYSLRSLHL